MLNAGHTCGLLPSRNLNSSMQGEDVINAGDTQHIRISNNVVEAACRVTQSSLHLPAPWNNPNRNWGTVFGFDSTGRSSVRVRVPLVL